MKLTYGMLLEQLKTLNDAQLKCDVAIFEINATATGNAKSTSIAFDFDIVGEESPDEVSPTDLVTGYPYLVKE